MKLIMNEFLELKKALLLSKIVPIFVAMVMVLFFNHALFASQQRSDVRLTGPYNNQNLSVFLIHGQDAVKGKSFLTLQEALAQKKVTVHETGNVNELSIENRSNELVFIQSGDIVKGGKQDRCMQYDLIVPPKSGKMPLSAFCVEQGRWSRRGAEKEGAFSGSTRSLATKELKLANRFHGDQEKVWEKVAEAQEKLKEKVAEPTVIASPSPSSLQLSLENKKVTESKERYVRELKGIVDRHKDVIGYTFAINGKINSADVYASHALFMKLWPKLLDASAVEAVASKTEKSTSSQLDSAAVQSFLSEPERAKSSTKPVNERTRQVTKETKKNVMFETLDGHKDASWIHKTYLAK